MRPDYLTVFFSLFLLFGFCSAHIDRRSGIHTKAEKHLAKDESCEPIVQLQQSPVLTRSYRLAALVVWISDDGALPSYSSLFFASVAKNAGILDVFLFHESSNLDNLDVPRNVFLINLGKGGFSRLAAEKIGLLHIFFPLINLAVCRNRARLPKASYIEVAESVC